MRLCRCCGLPFLVTWNHRKLCSKVCQNHRLREQKRESIQSFLKERRSGTITLLLQRDGPTCAICGSSLPLTPTGEVDRLAVDVDHIVPRFKGGEDSLDNIRLTHPSCNRSRTDY